MFDFQGGLLTHDGLERTGKKTIHHIAQRPLLRMAEPEKRLADHTVSKDQLNFGLALFVDGDHFILRYRFKWLKPPETMVFYKNISYLGNRFQEIIRLLGTFGKFSSKIPAGGHGH